MIIGIGLDIVELDRLRDLLARKPKFANRILTPEEMEIFAELRRAEENRVVCWKILRQGGLLKSCWYRDRQGTLISGYLHYTRKKWKANRSASICLYGSSQYYTYEPVCSCPGDS